MRNVAVILAGGTGSRIGGKQPKQLLPLEDGRTVLEHAVEAFEQADCIDEIVLIMHHDWIMEAEQMWLRNAWQKVSRILPGGKERWESSVLAIRSFHEEDEVALLLHDAARPWVSNRILSDVCEALKSHAAVTVAVPMTDTLYRVADHHVMEIPQRANYMRAQTPQAFHLGVIRKAYRRAMDTGHIEATDDCGILRRYMPEVPIYIVEGEEQNKKITYKEDIC